MKKFTKIISIMVVMIMMVTMLTGCGEIKKAEETVNNAFTALKEANLENAANYMNIDEFMKSDDSDDSDNSFNIDDKLFAETLFGRLEYEIVSSEKIDKNTVVVTTKITAVDMKPVISDFFVKVMQFAFANAFSGDPISDEEMDKKTKEMFVECASGEDLAMVTNEVAIKVVKVDKKWQIESSEELEDALLGGLVKAAEEISNSFNNEEE